MEDPCSCRLGLTRLDRQIAFVEASEAPSFAPSQSHDDRTVSARGKDIKFCTQLSRPINTITRVTPCTEAIDMHMRLVLCLIEVARLLVSVSSARTRLL